MQSVSLNPWLKAGPLQLLEPWRRKMETSPLARRLVRGAFWSLAGAALSRGLMLISSFVVARVLGKVSFGEMGMVQSTVGMLGPLVGFGMGMTATKFVAEFRASDAAKAGRVIALSSLSAWWGGAVLALMLVAIAPWLATHALAAPHLAPLLRIASLLLLLSAVTGAQTGALAGFEAFKAIAHVNFFSGCATLPLMVGGVYFLGLEGALWGLVGSQVVNCWLNHLALQREAALANVPLGYANCRQEWSVLWHFSFPALLCGVMVGPITWLCTTILIHHPNGYAEMGLFNAANQWLGVLMFLPGILGQAALPVLSERLGQKDGRGVARLLGFYIKFNLGAALPLVLFGSLASKYIMLAYGNAFADGWPTLVVVLLTGGLLATQSTVGQVLTASGRVWLGFVMNLGWGTAFLGFTLLLVSHGAFGVSLARLLAYLVHTVWTLGFAFALIYGAKAMSGPVTQKQGVEVLP